MGEEYFFGWIQAGGVRVHRKPQIAEDRAVCRSNKTNVALGCNCPAEVIFQHLLLRRDRRITLNVFLVASILAIQGAASPVTDSSSPGSNGCRQWGSLGFSNEVIALGIPS